VISHQVASAAALPGRGQPFGHGDEAEDPSIDGVSRWAIQVD
jgi:hypothetical protein